MKSTPPEPTPTPHNHHSSLSSPKSAGSRKVFRFVFSEVYNRLCVARHSSSLCGQKLSIKREGVAPPTVPFSVLPTEDQIGFFGERAKQREKVRSGAKRKWEPPPPVVEQKEKGSPPPSPPPSHPHIPHEHTLEIAGMSCEFNKVIEK